jgi:hypothetical protein
MKISGRIVYLLAAVIFFAVLIPAQPAYGASARIEISSDSPEVVIGESLYIYINISSDVLFGDFEANLTYDDEILEYQGGTPNIAGSSGFLNISHKYVSEGTTSRKYALAFKAIKTGTCDIAFSGPVMVYDYDTELEMPVSSNEYTVNVKALDTASDNAYLKSLKIRPSELTPAFDRNTFSYSTTVGCETERLIVEALSEDPNSIVKITGNDMLKEGENKIIISVIAESGTVIEYTIDVIREKAPPVEDDPKQTDNGPDKEQSTVEAYKDGNDTIIAFNGRYKLVEPDGDNIIPSGYIKTRIIISDISITVYAPEDRLDSEFLLIYAENDKGIAGLYRYDRTEKTLQRYMPDDDHEGVWSPEYPYEEALSDAKKYKSGLNKAIVLIVVLSVLCALLAGVCIHLFMRLKAEARKRRRR